MRLSPAVGPRIDLHARFRKELREQEFPSRISLSGNPMQAEIAQRLLGQHAPHIEVADGGEKVRLLSLEQHGSEFLAEFLEGTPAREGLTLLSTIPEDALVSFAEHQGISIVREERTPVRALVERVAKEQPQTFFSLSRSARNLRDSLRTQSGKSAKDS